MIVVFLVLSALAGGQWVSITDDPILMDNVEMCQQAAASFLTGAQATLAADDDIVALSANCIMGKVPAKDQKTQ